MVSTGKNGTQGWKGEGMSQEDFMYKDECIVLDENDNVIGHDNKYNCHKFNPKQPRGILHRAFSVFLFNSEGKLLLQQRAASKITFPNVWTNTCCSHPLYGYNPTEVDTPKDLATAQVLGVKHAAVRKLLHELGIVASEVPVSKFKFLTRLHYWAADVVTHGPESEWGEHEIDYILFIQANVTVKPNPEEVQDYKYVTLSELQAMMDPSTGLLWSPWFRIIVERFLVNWWSDLDATLKTNKFVDNATIHRFDPPRSHMGGLGKAGPYLTGENGHANGKDNDIKKQGAYGKIKTHSESKISQILRFSEVISALRVKFFSPFKENTVGGTEDLEFCDELLGKVSRSFAAVIRQLPHGLCVEITVFYLALRALDTIEDDMEAFAHDPTIKVRHLQNFYEEGLEDQTFSMTGVGKGDEARLVEEFYRVSRVFKSLQPGMQVVIKDITKRMGEGMAEFVSKDLGQGTTTTKEYDRYCHFVAGLVGEGLTRMFSESGLEVPQLTERLDLSNSMGLFLQKTNIIRDYLEDFVDGRAFWPQEVWKQYAVTGNLGDFAEPQNRKKALHCLNDLVTNALTHVPDCLDYLSRLKTPEVFRFCAIPQVMAIATLDKVFNNGDVFTGVVKIRKGLTCELILSSGNLDHVKPCFKKFAQSIASRVDPNDPSAIKTLDLCDRIVSLCGGEDQLTGSTALTALAPVVMGYCAYNLSDTNRANRALSWAGVSGQSSSRLLWGGLASCLAYLLGTSVSVLLSPSKNRRPRITNEKKQL